MNRVIKFAIALVFVSMSSVSIAQMASGKHDLTAFAGTLHATSVGQDLCRFCHTPHNSNAVAPLWDRNGPTTATFTLYSSNTMENVMGQPTGVSQGCLSCHDGVTAFDSLLGLTGTGGNDMGTLYSGSSAILGATLANDHPVGVSVTTANEMELAATIDGTALRLFGGSTDTVECASCHDPHDDTYAAFLRMDPAAGTLCETCHTK